MVYQEEDSRAQSPVMKTAPEIGPGRTSSFAPVQADVLRLENSGNLRGTAKRLATLTG
jgi:hypothetical protein